MSSKNKRKYNPRKAFERLSRDGLKDKAVVFIGGENGTETCRLVDTVKMREIPVYEKYYQFLTQGVYRWEVRLAVAIQESNGKEGTRWEDCGAPFECRQDELADSLVKAHAEFIAEMKELGNTIRGVGWVSAPMGADISDPHSIMRVVGDIYS